MSDREIVSKFKIADTKWTIARFEDENYFYDEFFRVYKNGEQFELANGSDYATETEAEVNILLEYRVDR